MRIAVVLILFSCSFFYTSTALAQKCDSLKVGVEAIHTTGGRSGELNFKPAVQGTWKTHLIGPTSNEVFAEDNKFNYKNLPSGYYDFYMIDTSKKYCVKHIKVKVD